jgi:glycerol-3-phosphate dehydrogenase (NAD(P)+)
MNFTVVGAGAWGTAFARHLSLLGNRVVLVPRRPEHAYAIEAARENAEYLPGIRLPSDLRVTADLKAGVEEADVAWLACPCQALRDTVGRLKPLGNRGLSMVVSLAKGMEGGTFLRPSQVIGEVLPGPRAGSLTGPTNALEVAKGLPAAMVLAVGAGAGTEAAEAGQLAALQAAISGGSLRVYTSDDLPGVEMGAAIKNVYAIAAGCADGLGFGDNSKAALLTRSLAEMVRVGAALGAKPETFYGLSGFGDLVATCHGNWSRNREFGQRIGEGAGVADLLANRKTVVEGYPTTASFAGLCDERRIDAPILREVRAILFSGKRPSDALAALMSRGLKGETSGLSVTRV